MTAVLGLLGGQLNCCFGSEIDATSGTPLTVFLTVNESASNPFTNSPELASAFIDPFSYRSQLSRRASYSIISSDGVGNSPAAVPGPIVGPAYPALCSLAAACSRGGDGGVR